MTEIQYGIKTPGYLRSFAERGKVNTISLIRAYDKYKEEPSPLDDYKPKIPNKKDKKLLEMLKELKAHGESSSKADIPEFGFIKMRQQLKSCLYEMKFAELVDNLFDGAKYAVLGERTIRKVDKEDFRYDADEIRISQVTKLINERPLNFTIPVQRKVTDVLEIELKKNGLIGSLQIAHKEKFNNQNLLISHVKKIDGNEYISRNQYLVDMGFNITEFDMLHGTHQMISPCQDVIPGNLDHGLAIQHQKSVILEILNEKKMI